MSDYQGNIVIKNPATPTGPAENGSAPGMWKLSEAMAFKRQGVWPTQGVAPSDQYFNYVSMLLSTTSLGNANNNLFVDSSGAFNPISRFGNTTQGSATPYSASWSNYSDNSGDYLTTGSGSSAFAFGTGNFTIEAWFYSNVATANWKPMISVGAAAQGQLIRINQSIFTSGNWGMLYPNDAGNADVYFDTGAAFPLNQWVHVALVRNGSTLTLYQNGVNVLQKTVGFNFTNTTGVGIGYGQYPADGVFGGYISNVRIVKGTAVYTSNFTPSTAPLTAISGTSLLTCQSNRFRDASSNNFTITVAGNMTVTDFSPFSPGYPGITYNQSDITNWSGYFDGNGDFLSLAGSPAFSIATSTTPFTIEGWIYPTAAGGVIFSEQFTGGGNTISIALALTTGTSTFEPDGTLLGLAYYNGSSWVRAAISSTSVTLNAWQHVAAVFTGSTTKVFINGVDVTNGSITPATTWGVTGVNGDAWYIAKRWDNGGSTFFTGHISNFRFVNGTAVYTTGFTPPTAPLTAISGTSLLTCQNAAFTDNSTNNFAITPNGNATVTGNSPFNTAGFWSNYFDGNGDYLSFSGTSALNQSGDFTIEAWIYLTATPSASTPIYAFETNNFMKFGINTSRNLLVDQSNVGVKVTGSTALNLNTWYHMAFVRSGSGSNNCKIYLNGVQEGQFTDTSSVTVSGTGRICSRTDLTSGFLTCYLSNLRVTNTAVYTSAFTPSTTPLTAISGTQLLTCQSGRFIDSSANAIALTRNGDVSVQSFDPFYTSTVASNGGSIYFDGTGDYLRGASGPAFALGAGDFTVEMWVYFLDTGGTNKALFDTGVSSNTGRLLIRQGDNGSTANVVNAFLSGTTAGSPTFNFNQWTHVAVVRLSGTLKVYINGVGGTGVTATADLTQNACLLGQFYDLASYFYGYMSDVRVTKGTAIYTANFTPPTAPLTPAANTTFLLNGMNAGIYDATAINDLETLGDTRVLYPTAFAPANYYAGYFDGNGDYVTVPSNAALAFGTGDFTIEFWTYRISGANTDNFIISSASSGGFFFGTKSNGWGYGSTGNFWSYNTGVIPALNTWQHVAISRSGTSIRIFVDGSQIGTTQTDSSDWSLATGGTTIGSQGASYYYNGYISNLRVLKGTALYTSNFTPPTSPLTAIANTSLLTCQNKTFIDNSSNAFTLTANGNATAGAVGPFTATGGTSIYFDGTTDYMVVSGNKADWTWVHNGLQNWTIEFWAYNVNTNDMGVFCTNTNSINNAYGAVMGLNLMNGAGSIGGHFTRGVDGARMDWYTGNILSPNQWNHVALQFNATTKNMEVYLNGISRAVTNQNIVNNSPTGGDGSAFAYSNQPPSFNPNLGRVVGGVTVGSYFNGYIEEMRITRGIRRYTSNFTPPTQAFPTY